MLNALNKHKIFSRFRGYFPVVIDVETAGFNPQTDALLELAAVSVEMDDAGFLYPAQTQQFHISPFSGSKLDPRALAFNGIDPYHPNRRAVPETEMLEQLFAFVRRCLKETGCTRAVLVGHNATFDHSFLLAAAKRAQTITIPFHSFVTFDTASLSALSFGETVLAKACQAAGISFDSNKAHQALYDTTCTAQLFCTIVNRWKGLGGWPISDEPFAN